jgi:hypothetical protein
MACAGLQPDDYVIATDASSARRSLNCRSRMGWRFAGKAGVESGIDDSACHRVSIRVTFVDKSKRRSAMRLSAWQARLEAASAEEMVREMVQRGFAPRSVMRFVSLTYLV